MNVHSKIGKSRGHFHLPGGRVGFLLVHGLGGTPVELRFVAQGLNRAGYTVLCPLLAGHGGSDILLNTATWQDWLETIDRAFDQLRAECDHIIVGGLSAGSVLSLHLAAKRHDEIEAITLFSPTFWPNGWAIPWYSSLFRLVRHKCVANLMSLRQKAPFGIKDERIRRFVLESLQSDGRPLQDVFGRRGGTVWEFKAMAGAARKLIGRINKPVLICHARQDDQSDLSNAFLLQRQLAGPVDVCILDDCYHMVTLDRQRTQVVDRTVAFADGLVLAQNSAGNGLSNTMQESFPAVVSGPQSA